MLPFTSFSVRVTDCVPLISEQLNNVLLRLKVPMPQLSVLPLSTCGIVSVATPTSFKKMVGFLQRAVGPDASFTFTLAVQVLLLPAASVACSVTVFKPIFMQVKELGVSDNVKVQLSVLPLFTEDGNTWMKPLGPKLAVTFLHFAKII